MDIFQEYPDEVEYIFKPSCVPLMRCAGCCGDEGLECVPVDVYNVTMEVRVQFAIYHSWLEGSKSAITGHPKSQFQRKCNLPRGTSLLTLVLRVTPRRVKR